MATSKKDIAQWTWESRKKLAHKKHMEWAASVLKSAGLKIGEGNLPPTFSMRCGYYKSRQERQLVFALSRPSDTKCECVLKFAVIDDKEDGENPCIFEDERKVWGDKKGRGFWYDRKADAFVLAVGVGVRDMLSVKQANGMNVVASCEASGLRGLEFPDETNAIHVCVTSDLSIDGDSYACQRAALALAKRFENSAKGRTAWLVPVNDSCLSNKPEKANFNDILQADPTGSSIRKRFKSEIPLTDVEWEPPEKTEGGAGEGDGGESEDSYNKAISKLNETYAAVMMGSSFVIIDESYNSIKKITEIEYRQIGTFKNFYGNKTCWWRGENGEIERTSLPEAWLKSESRRSYQDVVFDPNYVYPPTSYNLFQGFKVVEPIEGDWMLFRDHMYNVMCGSQDKLFDYAMRWFQHAYTDPGGPRPGVALVFNGGQGCGKGTVMDWFSELFKPHYAHLTDGNALVGRFNKIIQGKILIFADEALFAGNKGIADRLKGMVTEATMVLEAKNIDAVSVDNHMNLVISSNHEHVINAAMDERRYAMFQFGDERVRDYPYFNALLNQQNNGGLEALCHALINFNGSEINLRNPPETAGMDAQKTLSLESVQDFWRHVLDRRYIMTPAHCDWTFDAQATQMAIDNLSWQPGRAAPGEVGTVTPTLGKEDRCPPPYEWEEGVRLRLSFVYDEYLSFCREKNERYPKSSSSFWNATRREGKGYQPIFEAGIDFTPVRKGDVRFFVPMGAEQMRSAFDANVCNVKWSEDGGDEDCEVDGNEAEVPGDVPF